MEEMISKFFDSVTSFFNGGDHLPWCPPDIILSCEKELAETANDATDEFKSERIMRLSWALVHSKRPEDVQRGIAMLQASLPSPQTHFHERERLYLLAVGYYRSGDYPRCRKLVDQCLEIAQDWRQALYLKEIVEDHITKDGVIGIGITATAFGLLAGGIVAALARRSQLQLRSLFTQLLSE